MADRKKRIGIIVGIVVVVLLLCALYWQVNRLSSRPRCMRMQRSCRA